MDVTQESRVDYILTSTFAEECYTIEHTSNSDHKPVKAIVEFTGIKLAKKKLVQKIDWSNLPNP